MEKQEKVATRVVGARREQGNLSHWEVTVDWWQDAHAAGRLGYVLIKRVFDFLASLAGLIILAPLFIVIAIIIKVDDPKGPVFYSQQRLGRKERTFRMYKFRSMCVDADQRLKDLLAKNEVDGAMFKMKDDPRVTRIGHFIRRTSIDELPQLLNVLLGDMALVGPRPPLPREVLAYTDHDRQRLAVKPGCTGLWQVSGRNDVGFKEMVELDISYIEKRSIWLDLKIIFKTVGIMIRPNIVGGFVTIVGSGLGLILARNYAQARSDWWTSVWRRPVLKRVGAWTGLSWLWLLICVMNWLLWPHLTGLGGTVHLGATLVLTWVGGLWLLWSGFRLDQQLSATWRRWTQATFQEMLRLGIALTGILFVDICCVITICLWPATALVIVGLVFTWQQRCLRRLARRVE